MRQRANFFNPGNGTTNFPIGLVCDYNTSDSDFNVLDNQITDGQNMIPASQTSIKKRGGFSLYGDFIGAFSWILGGFNFVNKADTQEEIVIFNSQAYRKVSNTWTALTGVALAPSLKADGVYFPDTDKFYIVNGTDTVIKYLNGASADQTDTAFKKGKYITYFQNRLFVANLSGAEDTVWYTDLGVDTFTSTNFFKVPGKIVGIITYYDKVLIFTERKIYRLSNFAFDGTNSWVDKLDELPVEFGSIADRTIQIVNNFIYFVGQHTEDRASIYKCDGYKTVSITDSKIKRTMALVSTALLDNACAIADGNKYRVFLTESGQVTNTMGLVYDTINQRCYTPERRVVVGIGDPGVLWSSEVSGRWKIFAGSQSFGQVYQLDTNDGDYDELSEERYLTTGTANAAVDANPVRRAAQSFKLGGYNTSQTVPLAKVSLLMRKLAGTTTDLTVRIETDNNGKPSGTLVTSGSVTLSAFTDASYVWKTVTFSTAPALLGNTTYWLVVQHVTEGSGNSQYQWLGDSCTPTYARGNLATYRTSVTSSTDTFNPNADPETTSVDGVVFRHVAAESFSTLRAATTGSASSSGSQMIPNLISTTTTDIYQEMARGIMLFDTSSIPNDATIVSASVSFYPTSTVNDFSQSIGITSGTPASNTDLVAADYAVGNFGSTRFATDVSLNSLTVNSYNSMALNASGISAISLTGISKFALRLSGDIDSSAPTWLSSSASAVIIQTSENTNKPRLTVTYTSVTGVTVWTADAQTDQDFQVVTQSAIEAYASSKSFLVNNGKDYQLHRFEAIFSTVAEYFVEVGFSSGEFNTFTSTLVSLDGRESGVWGGTDTWGGGSIWGGAGTRQYVWGTANNFSGKVMRIRVKNYNANQQFEFNKITTYISPRLREA